MRFINHKNSTLTILNGASTINLKPGDVSKSFAGNVKLVNQFINLGDSTELAIVREGTVDDKVLSQCPAANRYVYDSVDNALNNMTVFHHGEHPNDITGESLNEIKDLRVKIEEQKEELVKKDVVISSLNKNIDSLTEDKNYLSNKIETLNKEYQGYKSQVTTQLNELNRKLEYSENQVKALNTTISELNVTKVALETKNNELVSEVAQSKAKFDNVNSDNDEKDQAIIGLTAQVADLENAKKIFEAETIKVKEELKQAKIEIAEKDTLLKTSGDNSELIAKLQAQLSEKENNLKQVIEADEKSKAIWNEVCQMFSITFEGGEWKCDYKGNE